MSKLENIPMKGITCYGDCVYYNWKKHRCTRAHDEGKPTDRFYADCPLPEVVKVIHGHWTYNKGITVNGTYYAGKYQCSVCAHWIDAGSDRNYCPNCGSRNEDDNRHLEYADQNAMEYADNPTV